MILSFQILISHLAGTGIMFTLMVILAFFLYEKKDPKDFYTILFSSTAAMCITYTLKLVLKVSRPEHMLVIEDGYRFPSGHATMAAVIMSLGIYYTKRHIHDKHLRYFLYSSAFAWYVLVSYSRLYLGVHYPIDVIVGGIIGIVSTLSVIMIFKHLRYYK